MVKDAYLSWLNSFEVVEDKWNSYKLREKYNADNLEAYNFENFYITGYDLEQAFLAGVEYQKNKGIEE